MRIIRSLVCAPPVRAIRFAARNLRGVLVISAIAIWGTLCARRLASVGLTQV